MNNILKSMVDKLAKIAIQTSQAYMYMQFKKMLVHKLEVQ